MNLASGRIYSGIVSRHWRLLTQKNLWLSEKSLTKLSDLRLAGKNLPLHAHTIDAAQQGFFKACKTTRALRKAGITDARFPWRGKKFRTTIWKNTGIKFKAGRLELSTGRGNPKLLIALPVTLHNALRFIEVRLVYNKKSCRYNWHVVVENGLAPKPAPETNTVSVDPGEIHPAVVGDEQSVTVITCSRTEVRPTRPRQGPRRVKQETGRKRRRVVAATGNFYTQRLAARASTIS